MKPLISIIVPVYNVAPYLRECLDSICAQNFKDWEVICVDDGSTDGSSAILEEYSTKDSRFRVIHQHNEGVSIARNRGIDVAVGEWLYFIDADDIIVNGALDILSHLVDDDKYDAYFLGGPIYFTDAPPISATGTNKIIMDIKTPQSGKALLLTGKLWGWPWIRFLRKSLFCKIHFPVKVANLEDSISLIDTLSVRARWCWIDIHIYGYRTRLESASRLMTTVKVKSIIKSFEHMYNAAREHLGCTHDEALVLMKQYSGHMSAYLARGIPSFSAQELREIYIDYESLSIKIQYQMAGLLVRIVLWLAYYTRTKFCYKPLLLGHEIWERVSKRFQRALS